MEKGYRYIKHTSDVGIEARGTDLVNLGNNLLKGFLGIYFESIPDLTTVIKLDRMIEFPYSKTENLFVDLMNELIFIIEIGSVVPVELLEIKIEEELVVISFLVTEILPEFIYALPIKAATYHQLEVKTDPEYFIRMIFDV